MFPVESQSNRKPYLWLLLSTFANKNTPGTWGHLLYLRYSLAGQLVGQTLVEKKFSLLYYIPFVFSSIRSYIQKLKIFFINPNVQFPVYLGSALRFRLRLLNYFYNQYLSETRDRTRGIQLLLNGFDEYTFWFD